MRLAYVLGEFPALSESFIRREMAEVERRGHEIVPCALGRSAVPAGDVPPEWLERAIYRSAWCRAKQAALACVGPKRGRERGEGIWASICGREWAEKLRGRGVERVHAQFISEPAAVGLVLASQLGVPLSVSAHARDIWVETSPLLEWIAKGADVITVCTQAGAEALGERLPAEWREKVVMIHHGLDWQAFASAAEKPWPRSADGPRRLLFVGRLVEKKGVGDLVAATAALRKRGVAVQCDVLGDGPHRPLLEQQAEAFGVTDEVVFHGYVTASSVAEFLDGTDLLVVPSIVATDGDRDGIPNVVLEALASGVPVVATRVGGLPELAEEYEVVWPAEAGDALDLAARIEEVLSDEALGRRLREKGLRVVREAFDVQRNVGQLLDQWTQHEDE